MEMLFVGLAVGAVAVGFAVAVGLGARAGSVGGALHGLEVAARAARDPALKAKLDAVLAGGTVATTPPPNESLRLLTVLQAEARLVDFLMEDVSGARNEQLGAAVRDIHRKAQAALKEHVSLGPVLGGAEGEPVTVPAGFDPAAVRVVGGVTGSPPFTGTLQHAGWRATAVTLPPPSGDGMVVQPAEVQVG
jgi:hypothetical protein